MKKLALFLFSLCCTAPFFQTDAFLSGKVDIGATYLDIDYLNSGNTIKRDHLAGVKADATVQIIGGFLAKASGIWGKSDDGKLASAAFALGHYFPVAPGLAVIPSLGVNFSYLTTLIDLELSDAPIVLEDLRERFRSVSPYLGLDVCYTFFKKWTFLFGYQYAWSYTHTKISNLVSDSSHCFGSNYTVGIEYSICKNLAVNFGVGYNVSLTKEKHGIRGKGCKLGIACYF